MELQIVLNTFASNIFRRQADLDYIAARSNFRMQLRQQFLWSAQQAIEKYLKGILLFNGMSARYPSGQRKEFGHDLLALVDQVKTINVFRFELDSDQEQFVRYLSKQGPNRYVGKTAYNTGEVLRQLDSLVWHIRRYCQYMPDRGLGCRTAVAGMRDAYVRAALSPEHQQHPQRFRLHAGELEKIVKRCSTDPARRALVWANLYYGAKRKRKVAYPTFSSSEIPPNERNWPDVDWELVEHYIKL
ncbi:MAG: HEPN domain-containing protein [Burkholderiales bacterium]